MSSTLMIFFTTFALTSFTNPTPYLSTGSSSPSSDKIPLIQTIAIKEDLKVSDKRIPAHEETRKNNSLQIPNFSAIKDVNEKKQRFLSFLVPKIRKANGEILKNRSRLLAIQEKLSKDYRLDKNAIQYVSNLRLEYKVREKTDLRSTVDLLLTRVDIVPASLVLAQAANESGWGTSRFARQANNLFGLWCYTPGCGLTPKHRDKGRKHQVAKYNSVQESVAAYLHTINSHFAYTHLREIRATKRNEDLHLSGLILAEGLLRYSIRGIEYVRDIQKLIKANELQKYSLPLKA